MIKRTDPRGASTKTLAAFSSATGVSLYDVDANSVRTLDENGSPVARQPRFRSPGLVSFVRNRVPSDDIHLFGQDSLFEVDLASGVGEEILRLPNGLLGYDWSPDGTLLAYLLLGDSPANVLCLFDSRIGATRALRSLGPWAGREGNAHDDVSLAWSAAATNVLVVDTVEEPANVFVVDLDGGDVVAPRDGTFARWLADGWIAFQKDPQDSTKAWEWFVVSTATDAAQRFGLPATALRPEVSPDGTMIAFDDGDADEPSVFVFDIDAGTTRRIARGYVAPIWLGPGSVAATEAGPCPPNYMCPFDWYASDQTAGINPSTGEKRKLALPTTLESFGVIDVLGPQRVAAK